MSDNGLPLEAVLNEKKRRIESKGPEVSKEIGPKSSLRNVWFVLAGLALVSLYAFISFDYGNIDWGLAINGTFANLRTIFLEAELSSIRLNEALLQVVITFAIAFLTTIFSAILSVVLGLFAARNLGGKRSSALIKGFVALIRAIPTVMWVLIFAIVAGLGSVAAVIGISFHSLGYLTKMFSESFEEMDGGVIEALKATGASWWEIVFQGVLPTTIRSLVAWTFMRFEINYIVALGMGAAAGAGGIGFNLFMAGNFYYNMREVGAVTFLILLTCFLLEAVSVRIKKSLSTK
ncbi:MAG: ABC transporter permease subunit [Trichococcus sp.]|uniref:PhnE/PtxC family ABC transporter permease n=1 Tax=Trichococcus sp. TaxID=1985464 RepID=UPI003C3B6147